MPRIEAQFFPRDHARREPATATGPERRPSPATTTGRITRIGEPNALVRRYRPVWPRASRQTRLALLLHTHPELLTGLRRQRLSSLCLGDPGSRGPGRFLIRAGQVAPAGGFLLFAPAVAVSMLIVAARVWLPAIVRCHRPVGSIGKIPIDSLCGVDQRVTTQNRFQMQRDSPESRLWPEPSTAADTNPGECNNRSIAPGCSTAAASRTLPPSPRRASSSAIITLQDPPSWPKARRSIGGMTGPSIDTQRAFYDRMWATVPATQLNNHEKARLYAIRRALDRLDLGSGLTVLDVGCGRGWLSGLLLHHYGHVTAYDLSPESITKARETFREVDFQPRDVMADPPDGEWDLVVSSEVIEHVQDQQRFVDTLVNVTKPSGHLLLTTPNARLRRSWESESHTFTPQPIENWLRRAELRAMFSGRCSVCDSGTFFFDVGRTGAYRMINNRAAHILRAKCPQIDRALGRTDLGLYQYAVARRITA